MAVLLRPLRRPYGGAYRSTWTPHRETPRKRISSKLDFHWSLADQWGLEAGGTQIRTPDGRLPMPMCPADNVCCQKSKLFSDWLKRTNFMLFLDTFSVIKPFLSEKGTIPDLEPTFFLRPASQSCHRNVKTTTINTSSQIYHTTSP